MVKRRLLASVNIDAGETLDSILKKIASKACIAYKDLKPQNMRFRTSVFMSTVDRIGATIEVEYYE